MIADLTCGQEGQDSGLGRSMVQPEVKAHEEGGTDAPGIA
jgi:hypothetical protein